MTSVLVLDNGGAEIKAATLPKSNTKPPQNPPPPPLQVPNALARPAKNAAPLPSNSLGKSRRPPHHLVAAEIQLAPDVAGMTFRRPIDRGFVTCWDAQRDIWASVFSADLGLGPVDFSDTNLLLTEPLAVPLHMRRAMDELVFESFEFAACATVPSQRLAASAVSRPVCLVLDSGFSFTTAVPIVDGVELPYCARRLSIGGKALTNFLKETVSFRSWNMMDETAVINAVKERLCYVSMAYFDELASTRLSNDIVKQYVLPDLSRGKTDPMGHVLTDTEERDGTEQLLAMNNERIAIPEILFNPSDVGLSQAGIPEVIFQAVEACPIKVRAEMYANIILTGGNCKFPNFKRRVEEELRPLVDTAYEVNVFIDEQPVLTAFKGAVRAVTGHSIPLKFVTKAMYEEHGTDNLLRMLYATQ